MKSDKEVKEKYLQVMADELGGVFYRLYSRLVELHIIWQQYRQLFGVNEEAVHLLNRTAGLFFKVVQDELWTSRGQSSLSLYKSRKATLTPFYI